MSDLRAEPLSPVDAATLWPQLGRLAHEVLAPRGGDHILLNSALAATGLTRLPRMPRTAVLGLRRGFGYRGVLVARELAGGAGWEAISLRIGREHDPAAVTALIKGTALETARRGGRTVYLRLPGGSPHAGAVHQGGAAAFATESLLSVPLSGDPAPETGFRPAGRADRHGIFRLYCHSVPPNVRHVEAPTQQDWRAVHDSFDCEREFVLEVAGGVAAWLGVGHREARILAEAEPAGAADAALCLAASLANAGTALVVMSHQPALLRRALALGYIHRGERLLCARRLVLLHPLKEVVAVPAETVPLPH